jgi:type III restriction enzyme
LRPSGRRRRLDTNKVGEAILSGWRNEELIIEETEGEMLQRACEDLLSMKNVVVMNDEAHHCYREKGGDSEEEKLTADDRQEAKENNEAARLWISGIEALKRARSAFAHCFTSPQPAHAIGS